MLCFMFIHRRAESSFWNSKLLHISKSYVVVGPSPPVEACVYLQVFLNLFLHDDDHDNDDIFSEQKGSTTSGLGMSDA